MKIRLNTLRWQDGDYTHLSHKHRWLLVCLECLADRAGVVEWDLDRLHLLAGSGVNYSRLDITALGSDYAVWMPDNYHILLSQYMQFQHVKLSRRCPAHHAIFDLIEKWWGKAEKGQREPYMEFMAQKTITRHAPTFMEEDQGNGEPAWKVQLKERVAESKGESMPDDIPAGIALELQNYFDWRCDLAVRAITKTDGMKHDWSASHVRDEIRRIRDWMNKFPTERIAQQLSLAKRENRLSFYPPK